eukprot:592542-Pyramimonas_sp.AAC.1
MAGAPADSESTTSAADEEIHAMLYPRVIGNPTYMELIDDDPLRGSARDAGDLSERFQYEPRHNEELQCTLVASDRYMSSQGRSPSRPDRRKNDYRDDDEDEKREDSDRMIRR